MLIRTGSEINKCHLYRVECVASGYCHDCSIRLALKMQFIDHVHCKKRSVILTSGLLFQLQTEFKNENTLVYWVMFLHF